MPILRVPKTSRLLLKVDVALVPLPMKMLPATENFVVGDVVPMPTCPLLSMVRATALEVAKVEGDDVEM